MKSFAVLFTASLLISSFLVHSPGTALQMDLGMEYYLSPDGSDSNPGTLSQPWITLAYALTQLSPGDVLNLREGTYFEHNLVVDLNGTASQPITIQSYPGERATIDGGLPDFQDAPNDQWELVDPSIHLYRSRQPVSYDHRLAGWLLDYDIQLLRYEDYETLSSTDYEAPDYYAGPGVFGRDGHVFIRLEQNPLDLQDRLGNPIPPLLSDLDPNQHRINIFSGYSVIRFEDASYVKLKNLDIGPARYSIEISGEPSPSHHIEIDGCYIVFNNIGVLARPGSHDLEIHHNEVTMGFPRWNYWGDVKSGSKPAYYSGWNSFAIAGVWENGRVHHNIIRDSFDGISVSEGSADSLVTDNTIIRSRDDAIDLFPNVVNVQVARNLIRQSYEGVSIVSGDEDMVAGDVYIHHNVIDLTLYHRADRAGNLDGTEDDSYVYDELGNAWNTGIAFGGHNCSDGSCDSARWKVYNNTVIAIQSAAYAKMLQRSIKNLHMYFYNNVFYVIGEGPIFYGRSTYNPSAGMHYDGNIYWKTVDADYLFQGFGGGSYLTLEEFQSDPATAPWERTNSLEVDPGYDAQALEEPDYDPEQLWDLYRPDNPQVFTLGAPYDGLDWPDTQGVIYRGAIPSSLSTFLPILLK
jgi:hypothetical protein